eukprot:TRINITY_DN4084_c0_g2_i1.p1 TRINITY_DN4084_c0_g2~~TRINITY_DN4084_c0_g2_i1.p1  ORF type:complete len:467 (+),score=83.36 TRINITY_DN4084_c0_g2_i1:117-1517(+)
MDDYREAQKKKWAAQKEAEAASDVPASDSVANVLSESYASASAGSDGIPARSAAAPPSSGAVASSSSSAAAPAAALDDGAIRTIRRMHILPVGAASGADPAGPKRLEQLAPELRRKRAQQDFIKTGLIIKSSGAEFVVVKAEPDEGGILGPETDYFVDGDPIVRFEKVQFICLWDFESQNTNRDPSTLFTDYISPYFKGITDSREDMSGVVCVGDTLKILDMEFQVFAAQPTPPDTGIIDSSTMVYVDWDSTPEFEKIHIVPFQDTLPTTYQFDVFNDYLKPYLTRNKYMRFAVNDHFTYQGVQFKVVCCEPNGPARIGRNTTIYCEGVLHPSLRNLLPPELLEQLSHLPPGLQMLLLNTEALAGGYEERLMEVQEMLSRRRGLSTEAINSVDKYRWGEGDRSEAQAQCMVCLSDFSQGEEVRRLPCGHVFHATCIDEWLRRCMECPICKANVGGAVNAASASGPS